MNVYLHYKSSLRSQGKTVQGGGIHLQGRPEHYKVNSFAPRKSGSNLKLMVFMSSWDIFSISFEITLQKIPQRLTGD